MVLGLAVVMKVSIRILTEKLDSGFEFATKYVCSARVRGQRHGLPHGSHAGFLAAWETRKVAERGGPQ